jgi:hypothetical protein
VETDQRSQPFGACSNKNKAEILIATVHKTSLPFRTDPAAAPVGRSSQFFFGIATNGLIVFKSIMCFWNFINELNSIPKKDGTWKINSKPIRKTWVMRIFVKSIKLTLNGEWADV